LLCGGGDVDPSCYGAAPHALTAGIDELRDAFELSSVRAALDAGIPVLAICRGMQVLNVACGGTLHQHLGDLPGTILHRPDPPALCDVGVLHTASVASGTRLADALGSSEPLGSSYHHQAIDRVGTGLSVTAKARDGVIEAVEHEQGWVVGVQWHPEDTAARDEVQQNLFDAFVREAARR
jgi:putative glutamine amidotransferase